jgi:hypothetical protein
VKISDEVLQNANAPKGCRPTTRSNQANLFERSKWLTLVYARLMIVTSAPSGADGVHCIGSDGRNTAIRFGSRRGNHRPVRLKDAASPRKPKDCAKRTIIVS